MPFYRPSVRTTSGFQDFETPRDALNDAVEPKAYCYDGKLEYANDKVNSVVDVLGRLMNILHEKNLLNDEDVVKVLGYGWSTAPVKED